MRSIAFDDGAQAENRIVTFLRRDRPNCDRKLPGSGNPHDIDFRTIAARTLDPVQRARQKPVCNEAVKAAYYDGEAQPGGVQFPFE